MHLNAEALPLKSPSGGGRIDKSVRAKKFWWMGRYMCTRNFDPLKDWPEKDRKKAEEYVNRRPRTNP